jgi:hypothetical protein
MVQERTEVAFPNEPQLIISIKEMRKLLGADGNGMSDDQIEHLIMTLTESSSMLLNQK